MELTALINDTTGTLIASHYVNPKTKIAVIFGTGCNAAYIEHIKEIPKVKHLGITEDLDMAINCEWVRKYHSNSNSLSYNRFREPLTRLNTSNDLPRTKYDIIMDQTSNKPDEQALK